MSTLTHRTGGAEESSHVAAEIPRSVDVDDRREALVTGCSSSHGLGANTALALVAKGYRVFATARKLDDMDFLKGKCELLALDISDEKSRVQLIETVSKLTNGRLDVLVNNAGIPSNAPILDLSLDAFRNVLEVNLVAPLAQTQGFALLLVDAANSAGGAASQQRKGVVVNIGSCAHWGLTWNGAYGSSKAGFQTLSDVLRVEMAPLNVRVITVELGGTRTPMYSGQRDPGPQTNNTTSLYYPSFPDIASRNAAATEARDASDPQAVGRQLADIIDRHNPKGKVWLGSGSAVLKYMMPLLEWFSLGTKDWIFSKNFYVALVSAPKTNKE